jgi:hypothetical protein
MPKWLGLTVPLSDKTEQMQEETWAKNQNPHFSRKLRARNGAPGKA